MAIKNKCKYCLSPLDKDGYCSKPCKLGKLQKQIAELKAKLERIKSSN